MSEALSAIPTDIACGLPETQLAIRRAVLGLCRTMNWAAINEFSLPAAGRRADVMALLPDHSLICIEIKSGLRDFQTDQKWPEYRDWSDRLFFAVDDAFPVDLIPPDVGLIVVSVSAVPPALREGVLAECTIIREPALHRLAPARRRTLVHLFATTAAIRLMGLEDPAITSSLRAARRAE
ncbi:MmcB family DNA repair protein [Gluconobacter sp. Dm-74]|uniref:MmcB family DNA repair protein n=1 Tax=Gluconobacter sp. Dm-74 TaxID=2799803 RepID=UPI001B8D3331|nr:MmcB family DNA repair protein [Gluconobacter sp. Dm-74]MBS1090565.1 MmcB family DNA repair protein [Gluconobacter sp. Dm-74]